MKMIEPNWDALNSLGFTTEEALQAFSELGSMGFWLGNAYIAGWQQPTRWQQFCSWFRDFWLTPRW